MFRATENKNSSEGLEDNERTEREMTFLDHLEELRWRLVKSVVGLLVATIVCGIFSDWLVNEAILRPSRLTNPPLVLISSIRPNYILHDRCLSGGSNPQLTMDSLPALEIHPAGANAEGT
jgi:hypothetical protein